MRSTVKESMPRIAREGYEPAGPRRRPSTNHMLIPKPKSDLRDPNLIEALAQALMPIERLALEIIIEHAQLIEAEDGRRYLAIMATPELINVLAYIESDRGELEAGGDHELNTGDDEPITGDDEPGTDDENGSDDEPDSEGERSVSSWRQGCDTATHGEGDADGPAFVMDQSSAG